MEQKNTRGPKSFQNHSSNLSITTPAPSTTANTSQPQPIQQSNYHLSPTHENYKRRHLEYFFLPLFLVIICITHFQSPSLPKEQPFRTGLVFGIISLLVTFFKVFFGMASMPILLMFFFFFFF